MTPCPLLALLFAATLAAVDAGLPNPGFEDLDPSGAPQGWTMRGSARCTVDAAIRHGGARSVAVADAGDGPMSGWSTVLPARPDRSYRFVGWAKGGKLAANGFLPGGALQLEFLDGENRPLGAAVVSGTVGVQQDWSELATAAAQPPPGATRLRLTVGLRYCNGTAWFDDLRLEAAEAEALRQALVRREPKPDPACRFSANLLPNPDLEAGAGEVPAQWIFVGSGARDWSEAAIATFHREGRPHFDLGRALGVWNHDRAYAGRGALRLEAVDPPLSKRPQWYGRNPVDGFWLSAPMPCVAGERYLAAAWACPGAVISEPWFGPLELRFYDAKGGQVNGACVRAGMGGMPAATWSWWATRPWQAPAGAVSMRLRVGQELVADAGGWGVSLYDNLAVWRLDGGVSPPPDEAGDTATHRTWLRSVFAACPPPYLAAPASAAAYPSTWVRLENATVGNCFRDPSAPVRLSATITNLLGEQRTVRLRAQCTDWKGATMPAVRSGEIALHGYADASADIVLPAPQAFGTYHLDLDVEEGEAVVGSGSGRFGELPALDRPRSVPAIWGVTPLMDLFGDGRASERELGEMLHLAGFGIAWVRTGLSGDTGGLDPAGIEAEVRRQRPVLAWYRALGIRPVLQIYARWRRPITREAYIPVGRAIARASADLVAAYGDHGIEQANSGSPYRGMPGGERLSDAEYDAICAGLYAGLKAEAPRIPVLIGNIATDWECTTIKRLYGEPVQGAFDGAILNAYMGVTMTVMNTIATMDAHGDTAKTVWQEETANQRSPSVGEQRRYGEGQGAANLVRSWLEAAIKAGPRLKAFTMWGFRARGGEDDIAMVNEQLQPRPQFAAHAVMADALADATFVGDRSTGQITGGEWRRGDGQLLVLWANSSAHSLTVEVPRGGLTVMDLMGNRRDIRAVDGLAVVEIGTDPIYVFGGGTLAPSRRLELSLGYGTVRADQPQARLELRNNQDVDATVQVAVRGAFAGAPPASVAIPAHGRSVLDLPLRRDLPTGKRSPLAATATTASGGGFATSADLDPACAVRATGPVPLAGRWEGPWSKALVMPFGRDDDEVVRPSSLPPGVIYKGTDDILGNLRLLWDEHCLYLGVEALDDVYCPIAERSQRGFMGDSVEFAAQPDGILSNLAPRFEYEFFRPKGDPVPVINRRFPSATAGPVADWLSAVIPTGHRGDVNYQLAIPWAGLGIADPALGRRFTLGVILNDADSPDGFGGGRCRIRWFRGVDTKNTEGFGDVVLAEAPP